MGGDDNRMLTMLAIMMTTQYILDDYGSDSDDYDDIKDDDNDSPNDNDDDDRGGSYDN